MSVVYYCLCACVVVSARCPFLPSAGAAAASAAGGVSGGETASNSLELWRQLVLVHNYMLIKPLVASAAAAGGSAAAATRGGGAGFGVLLRLQAAWHGVGEG